MLRKGVPMVGQGKERAGVEGWNNVRCGRAVDGPYARAVGVQRDGLQGVVGVFPVAASEVDEVGEHGTGLNVDGQYPNAAEGGADDREAPDAAREVGVGEHQAQDRQDWEEGEG